MHITAITLLVLQCTLCLTIRVPVWNHNSEVKDNEQFPVETIEPQHVATTAQHKPIPNEYFEYTAQKPQFAVDIAKFHGVQSPENNYKAYPIKPYTGVAKPELGKHQMLDKDNKKFRPYQEYVKKTEAVRHVTPSTTSYEVFHPYKLEELALKELYQDPVMDKIRNDLIDTKERLQKYEDEAGKPDVTKGEYLEPPEETDRKKIPHRNVPARFEIHRPQRRPVYYRPPVIHNHREHALNQKIRHPWNQNYVKVTPIHYRPVKNHLHRLRQQHSLKYDDEHNEYPQLPPPEKYSEPADGYDIYQKGKAKYVQLRNNVDESLNKAVQESRPAVNQKLELNNEDSDENSNENDDEDEFVPIKNYAQVRRTETKKHLPKEAAFHDADTLDEIRNAPRLREAIKSTKAQTVYSEEGYEDSAYDHAGEQKHASDHEGHGGFLKEKELSGGKYKTPTFSASLEDAGGSEYRDQVEHAKKWKDNDKDTEEETDSEDYSENEAEHSDESEKYNHKPIDDINRNKREDESDTEDDTSSEVSNDKTSIKQNNTQHDVNKREAKISVPEINLNTTYLTEKDILEISKLKILPKKEMLTDKYPYYSKKLKAISKHSPLRYAENLKLIPKKSAGGTEFYDSRSKFECPEVEDDIDPVPEKLKKGGHPDEQDEEDDEEEDTKKDKSDFSALESKPRLAGLGDKIDCFKAKYFGENPLDSPFFKEEIISNPEPVTIPSLEIYKLKQAKEQSANIVKSTPAPDLSQELHKKGKVDIFTILDELYNKENIKKSELTATNGVKVESGAALPIAELPIQTDIIQSNEKPLLKNNLSYVAFLNKEDVTKLPRVLRRKRSTPFVYEPYKIIRDSQIQDSKKTTTTNNISPLIKQLQSSRVVDKVQNQVKEQVVKRNAASSANIRTYKDIGRSDREKNVDKDKGSKPETGQSFVDVSVDQRRGEPRYELKPANHKSQYTPVENKKSISREDYKAQSSDGSSEEHDSTENNKKDTKRRSRVSTERPFFDVSKFLPHVENSENTAESIRKVDVQKIEPQSKSNKSVESNENDDEEEDEDEEEDDEYEDDDEDDYATTTTTTTSTTTTTVKPVPRRRIKITSTTTTNTPDEDEEVPTEAPKLRLVTRFRNSYQTEKPKIRIRPKEISTTKRYEEYQDDTAAPKYREKKKKSSKSTLVTDTKSYGDDDDNDDDMRKDEVDALIGVKQDIKEYMPEYEKEAEIYNKPSDSRSESHEDDEDDNTEDHDNDDEDDEDRHDHEDENEDEDDDEDEEDETEEEQTKPNYTTPEPTKRTLARTTEAPPATTEARSAKLEVKPVVSRKKIEIHKELPVNRSSPHKTEFKQDIKEVEIIKEIPARTRKKPQKNIEVLDLYKDENLAKDVNKLGGVEIFKDGLDLANGPKHGGNYRNAEKPEETTTTFSSKENLKSPKADVETSQSKTSKLIELKDEPYSRRKSDIQRARNSRGRSAKLIELSDVTETPTSRPMHGGNFKSIYNERRRGGSRNAKLIELDDDDHEDNRSTDTHGGPFKSYGSRSNNRPMHGGNYRSAKIVQDSSTEETTTQEEDISNDEAKDDRRSAAMVLNNFARAIPVLTTTPAYILDPSKRMYYYVDA